MVAALECICCGRLYVSVRTSGAACPGCGASLEDVSLPPGVYQLDSPSTASANAAELIEEDLGYGESHGYGPAHGGPTGPGDAPAPQGR